MIYNALFVAFSFKKKKLNFRMLNGKFINNAFEIIFFDTLKKMLHKFYINRPVEFSFPL